MIVVLQRVKSARVRVGREVVGAIDGGYCLLAGALDGDRPEDVAWLAAKIAGLRLFPDASGRVDLALPDVGGEVLLVPQFTLAADWRKGRRPSFVRAAPPERGRELLAVLAAALREAGVVVAEGRFGAAMEVELVNDGPFTLVLDTDERRSPRPREGRGG